MSEKTVIIIGAGLAGLSAGCYAQMNGYRSHIFEHHSLPGGVAASWRRKEYLIDGGIHFIMSHKPGSELFRMYQELGIVPANRFVDLATYGRFVHEPSGRVVTVTHDLGQLAADLKAVSPADARLVDDLVDGARSFQGPSASGMWGMGRPPELLGPADQIRELWAMRSVLKHVMGRLGQPVTELARGAHDPVLRVFLESLFSPDVPAYFVLMLLGLLADGQIGLIEGGSHDLVRAIESRYRALGGEVTYRATVEEILVDDDHAVGVRLAEGSELRSDYVVSAADGYSTIFKMLGGRYADDTTRKRYATWRRFKPLMIVSYGVAREFPDEPAFGTLVLERPLTVGRQEVRGLFTRIFNYSRRFAPPGKTVVQVEFETEWDYWNDLQHADRSRYDAEKARVAAEVLGRLERHYPELVGQVEMTDVATPYTTWRYTLNDRAAWEGWLMTPEQIRTPIKRGLPGLKDFYMAGQWVMPGGGVPPCLYSGQHAVQLLCRQDGKPFSTVGR